MFAVILSGLFNVFGDCFLVFICDMGMAGAAIATIAGNAIQVLIYIGYFFTKKCRLKFVKPYHLLKAFRRFGLDGIWWSMVLTEIIVFVITTIYLATSSKKLSH